MNLNNLEALKLEMKALGFGDKITTLMEEQMRNNIPNFALDERFLGGKGQVNLTLYFKQSSNSEYYYMNRFEAYLHKGTPLEQGQKYLLITKDADGRNQFKKLENMVEAITLFKRHTGNCELAIGKDVAHKTPLVMMEEGKVNYLTKDFQQTFYAPPIPQTFWVDHGKGYTAEQAVNLMQGRAVYRDDLLSRDGHQYKAWMILDIGKPRDRYNNFTTRQFMDPNYGFDLKRSLNEFKIKDLEDPKKVENLELSLRHGNRPIVTVEKGGEQVKVFVETAVRYGKINFFDLDGKTVKQGELLKAPALNQGLAKVKRIGKGVEEGMGIER
ncbi:hypothetical protein OQX61_02030 [Pedobacter sp. PLR]|uniref:hypothetical protein n=1 Tax=Pedobacter sp. PLR TaxID=2994465 RepID=UPI0022459919|nr:hypothetical protein [Pedobacter sp. PLR]MCX2450037.1 hypothetical protein [Pedobacter sp. PLR]